MIRTRPVNLDTSHSRWNNSIIRPRTIRGVIPCALGMHHDQQPVLPSFDLVSLLRRTHASYSLFAPA
jgi:hypothetical protein